MELKGHSIYAYQTEDDDDVVQVSTKEDDDDVVQVSTKEDDDDVVQVSTKEDDYEEEEEKPVKVKAEKPKKSEYSYHYFNDEDDEEDEDTDNVDTKDMILSTFSTISTWFIRIGMGIAVILLLYFIFTGKIGSALLYILGLIIAFFFGYFFMLLLDKITSAN